MLCDFSLMERASLRPQTEAKRDVNDLEAQTKSKETSHNDLQKNQETEGTKQSKFTLWNQEQIYPKEVDSESADVRVNIF